MRENKKKESIFAKRGFFITLVVITSVMVIAVVMNMVLPEEPERETFDSEAWQSAVQQSAQKQADGETEAAKAVSASAIPIREKTREEPERVETAAAVSENREKAKPEQETKPEPESTPAETGVKRLEKPVSGGILKDYSGDELVYSETMDDWRVHEGIDFSAEENADVRAAADGTVESVSEDGMLGACMVLGHDGGLKTFYGNLQEGSAVPVGTSVKAGEVIAKVGKTAALEIVEPAHLHFEVINREKSVNPHDYLKESVEKEE